MEKLILIQFLDKKFLKYLKTLLFSYKIKKKLIKINEK